MPDISIVTPSLNQARFVERTIQSVLDQDLGHRVLEYVVIDGGSSDGTLQVLQRYSASLHWISEPDGGQAEAINKGLRMTSGEIVGWLNSDDVYYPEALLTVSSVFDAHPEIDVVYGAANHIDEADRVLESYNTENWDFERLKEVCYISQPSVFMRRRAITLAGALDERLKFCLDYEYWLRLAQLGASFAYAPETLAGSRLYPGTKTLGQRVRFHAEINAMLRARLGRVPERWIFNYAHAVLEPTKFKPTQPLRFALAVSAVALYASLRWNRGVSQSILATTTRWIAGNVRGNLVGTHAP
jgi:glycosyltransferase involved in cell wall biosynthesis